MKHSPTNTVSKTHFHTGSKAAAWCAGLLATLLLTNVSLAADKGKDNSNARYEQERSVCLKGESPQARDTCLREAAAAKQQTRAGQLTTESEEQLQRNRERRCEAQPAADREFCLQRMRGAGTQSGSVEGGGIVRELRVVVKPGQ